MFSALLAFNCIYFSSDNNSMFARQQKEENLSKYKSMNSPQERKRQNLPHYLGSERKEKKKKSDQLLCSCASVFKATPGLGKTSLIINLWLKGKVAAWKSRLCLWGFLLALSVLNRCPSLNFMFWKQSGTCNSFLKILTVNLGV